MFDDEASEFDPFSINTKDNEAARVKLDRAMSSWWVQFARTGNPNHGGLPEWPVFDAVKRPTMIFDNTCAVKGDPDGEELKALAASMKWS